jgi:hypothetical protein
MSGKSAEGISGGHYFFRVLAFAFFFGWSVAWGPATAAELTPETQTLFLAVSAGDMKAVERSVLAGADVNGENASGLTPIDLAVDLNNFKIAHYLLLWRKPNKGAPRARAVIEPPYQEIPRQPALAPTPPAPTPPAPTPVVIMERPPPSSKKTAVAEPAAAPAAETAPQTAAAAAPHKEIVSVAKPEAAPALFERIVDFFSFSSEDARTAPETEQAAAPEPEFAPVETPLAEAEPAPGAEAPAAEMKAPAAETKAPAAETKAGPDVFERIGEFFSFSSEVDSQTAPETEQAAAPAPVEAPAAEAGPALAEPPSPAPGAATETARAGPVAAAAGAADKAAAQERRIDPVLGLSLRLGKPMAVESAEICIEKKSRQLWFCIEEVDWPKEIADAFQVRTVLYRGAQAIVRYDNGVASQFHTLFPTRYFDAVTAYFAERLGTPGKRFDNWAYLPAEPNRMNRTMRWRGPEASVLEIRQIDDLRWSSMPDTRHGVVRIYAEDPASVFRNVSWSDFMLARMSNERR